MARAFPATVLLKTLHPQHHHRTQSSHLLAPTIVQSTHGKKCTQKSETLGGILNKFVSYGIC